MKTPQRHVKFTLSQKIRIGILSTIASVGIGIWIAYIIDLIISAFQ